ncbi:MAG: tryptophan synthase subunit alpha [Gammaproteobacteria bacterium]|nr:tryptophan synthase subunit alpha [Gammaproteobacteria bacterium]MYB37249.1 tryptophan synthase subunit alpha [Gammaproteobacteria bacterium]
MALESYIKARRRQRDVLLMTHIVIGYPDYGRSMQTVEAMVEAGVDLMELQVPFSEPIADGPVILGANQRALAGGMTVSGCLDFAGKCAQRFDIPFVIMSYYNILHRYGVAAFADRMSGLGLKGAIVPDLPPEEAREYLNAMDRACLDPILLYSPNTSDERMAYLAEHARGFVYCVARPGVTGAATEFSEELTEYLGRCRAATELPLAVGLGIRDGKGMKYLRGKADIAIVGSHSIRTFDEQGTPGIRSLVQSLVAASAIGPP